MTINDNAVRWQDVPELKTAADSLSFGKILRNHRQNSGLSQVIMAKQLHISKQQLCDYEHGRKFPSLSKGIQMATLMGLSVSLVITMLIQEQLDRENLNVKFQLAS